MSSTNDSNVELVVTDGDAGVHGQIRPAASVSDFNAGVVHQILGRREPDRLARIGPELPMGEIDRTPAQWFVVIGSSATAS